MGAWCWKMSSLEKACCDSAGPYHISQCCRKTPELRSSNLWLNRLYGALGHDKGYSGGTCGNLWPRQLFTSYQCISILYQIDLRKVHSFHISLCIPVQTLLRESQIIRETKEAQILELKKMCEQSAESLKNEWEKKVTPSTILSSVYWPVCGGGYNYRLEVYILYNEFHYLPFRYARL